MHLSYGKCPFAKLWRRRHAYRNIPMQCPPPIWCEFQFFRKRWRPPGPTNTPSTKRAVNGTLQILWPWTRLSGECLWQRETKEVAERDFLLFKNGSIFISTWKIANRNPIANCEVSVRPSSPSTATADGKVDYALVSANRNFVLPRIYGRHLAVRDYEICRCYITFSVTFHILKHRLHYPFNKIQEYKLGISWQTM